MCTALLTKNPWDPWCVFPIWPLKDRRMLMKLTWACWRHSVIRNITKSHTWFGQMFFYNVSLTLCNPKFQRPSAPIIDVGEVMIFTFLTTCFFVFLHLHVVFSVSLLVPCLTACVHVIPSLVTVALRTYAWSHYQLDMMILYLKIQFDEITKNIYNFTCSIPTRRVPMLGASALQSRCFLGCGRYIQKKSSHGSVSQIKGEKRWQCGLL